MTLANLLPASPYVHLALELILAAAAIVGPIIASRLRETSHPEAASVLEAVIRGVETFDRGEYANGVSVVRRNVKDTIQASAIAAGVEPQLNAVVKSVTEPT